MENGEPTKTSSALLEGGAIMILLFGLLYTAGWSYAYHYFDHFHLGLLGLDIPHEYFFIYSFKAINDQRILSFFALIALVGAYLLFKLALPRFEKRFNQLGEQKGQTKPANYRISIHALSLFLSPVLIFSLFIYFYHIGDHAAKSVYSQHAKANYPYYPRVKVWLTDSEKQSAGVISREWEKGCYRLLLKNKDNLYLFYPGKPWDKIPTEIIPTGKVRSVRVLPHYFSCKD